MATKNVTANAAAEKQGNDLMTVDTSFMEGMGSGFEDMGASATSISYLSLIQPDSDYESDETPAGTWRNTASEENFGQMITVVPIAFRTIWSERDSQPPFATIGRYPVKGIPVEIRRPAKGKPGYPQMINPETGNEVNETYVYAVIIPEHPEVGVLYYTPTLSSMKTCRSWNSQLKAQILPNGVQAPIFAFKWDLYAALVQNPAQPNRKMAKFTKVVKNSLVDKTLFETAIKPIMDTVRQEVLMITDNLSEVIADAE